MWHQKIRGQNSRSSSQKHITKYKSNKDSKQGKVGSQKSNNTVSIIVALEDLGISETVDQDIVAILNQAYRKL